MVPQNEDLSTYWWEHAGTPLLQSLTGASSKLPYSIVAEAQILIVRYLTSFTKALARRDMSSLAQAIDNLEE